MKKDNNVSQLRILFITAGSPWPTNIGVNQRTHLLLRALQNCGKVDTVINDRYVNFTPQQFEYAKKEFSIVKTTAPSMPGEKWPYKPLHSLSAKFGNRLALQIGGQSILYRSDANISTWLTNRLTTHHYDVIVGRYLKATATAGALAYSPILLDMDDCDVQVLRSRLDTDEISSLKRLSLRRKLRSCSRLLPKLLNQCAHIWIPSIADRQFVGDRPYSVLPNIPFVDHYQHHPKALLNTEDNMTVLMIGSFAHNANIRGVDRFLKKSWPLVQKQLPQATFRIVGFGMTETMRSRWAMHNGVQPIGYTEALDDEYRRSSITVVPVFEGGGTKIKILESLMNNRPCVVAKHSQRGYEHILKHKESLWVADNDTALAEGCITLLKDAKMRNELAAYGRDVVTENFSRSSFNSIVEKAVESIVHVNKGILRQPTAAMAY